MEPTITINGIKLTNAQSMAVRVAVSNFRLELSDKDHRTAMGEIGNLYDQRLAEVERIITNNF